MRYLLNMISTQLLRQEAMSFLDQIFLRLAQNQLRIEDHWHIDHLCYRCKTIDEYVLLKKDFESLGELLVEAPVNGRPISTFKLFQPFEYQGQSIDLLELPSPKFGKTTQTGFEHFEVVCDLSFESMIQLYSALNFDQSGLKKDFNQELEMVLQGGAVKFHHLSLESVVTLENNRKVWNVIENLQILKILKEYQPLIAGTFPLGIQIETSDVDILVEVASLESFESRCIKYFSVCDDFDIQRSNVDGLETSVVGFKSGGVPFELFAQNRPAIQQKAYLHFLVEERLLKWGGERLRKRVVQLKESGLKTEPAFAAALGLSGDPYLELLRLQTWSNQRLKALITRMDTQ